MPAVAERIALDTSVAVPLLVATHAHHRAVTLWRAGRPVHLCGHALLETYSVLTRLPNSARLTPGDAERLMSAWFEEPVSLSAGDSKRLPRVLAGLGIAGGATYDGSIAYAALRNRCILATRDVRARATYTAVGVRVETVA